MEGQHENRPAGLISNSTYDVLKFIAQIFLPALGAFYFALSQIWGLPAGEEVVGTITSFDLFLGTLLGLSSKAYKDSGAKYVGLINVHDRPEKKTLEFEWTTDPHDVEAKKEAVFKVRPVPPNEEPPKPHISA